MTFSRLGVGSVALALVLGSFWGCAGAGDGAGGGGQSSTGGQDGFDGLPSYGGAGSGTESAQDLAEKLGRDHFLIGMGNDLDNDHNQDGAYTLGVTLDLHYAYLVGLLGQGGWPDWNPDGSFINVLTDTADAHGVVPMFTLYSMAAKGEGNAAALTDDGYMKAYWDGAKLMYERLAIFGKPAVVQFEPDFWGFTQQQAANPADMPVHVTNNAPDCADQPDNVIGMGHCLVALARKYAPQVVVGFHASPWANPDSQQIASYLLAIGADASDFVTLDALDRDAGCFEAHTDPYCQRADGPWYWDESNQTSPNFHEHLAWAESISTAMSKPLLWWQVPFGVPSDTPGGSSGAYRDNRVHYIFNHIDEFIAAGGVGVAFGVGTGNQTYITSDGGQFQSAVTRYFASPAPL